MNNRKINSLLGFAQKAGKMISGENTVLSYLRKPRVKIYLALIARDTSKQNKDRYISAFERKGIKYKEFGTKSELGYVIGKSSRAVVAILDKGFANKILELLEEDETCDE